MNYEDYFLPSSALQYGIAHRHFNTFIDENNWYYDE